eukprot:97253-Rhodomonas_salina.1
MGKHEDEREAREDGGGEGETWRRRKGGEEARTEREAARASAFTHLLAPAPLALSPLSPALNSLNPGTPP